MSNITTLYVGNDTLVDLEALKNELTGLPINDAVVAIVLRDEDGVEVGGEVWPKPMPHVAGSAGVYRVTMPHTLALIAGRRYYGEVTSDAGAGLFASWTVELVARAR